jgi:hypothetical protein
MTRLRDNALLGVLLLVMLAIGSAVLLDTRQGTLRILPSPSPSSSTSSGALSIQADPHDTQVVEAALTALQGRVPAMEPYLTAAAQRGVTISVQPLSPGIGGQYVEGAHQIVLNSSILLAPLSVVAAITAHEVVHAGTWQAGRDDRPFGCLEQGVHARTLELLTFSALTAGPSEWARSPVAAGEEDRVVAARAHGVIAQIVTDAGYQSECFGHALYPFNS